MNPSDLQEKTFDGLSNIWQKIIGVLPDLIVCLTLLIIGWAVASLINKLLKKMLNKMGFDSFLDKLGFNDVLSKMEVNVKSSQIIAFIVSLFVFMIFVIGALDIIGFTMLSGVIDTFILFFPKVLASFSILICGFFIGQIIFNAVRVATKNTGVDYGRSVAEMCRGIVIIITISLAITQLDIDVTLLNTIISVVIASVGLAAAISLGIGTKSLAKEIVSGVYLRELFGSGVKVKVDDIEGIVISIGSVATTILVDKENVVSVPNTFLLNNKVTKITSV